MVGEIASTETTNYNGGVSTQASEFSTRGIRWRRVKRALERLGAVLEANPAGEQFARLGGHQVKLPGSDRDRDEPSEDEWQGLLKDAERMGLNLHTFHEALRAPKRQGTRPGGDGNDLDEEPREAERVPLGALLDEAELEPSAREAFEQQLMAELSHAHSPLSRTMTEMKGMTWPPDQAPSFSARGAEAVRHFLADALGRPVPARENPDEPGPEDQTLHDVILGAGGDQSELQRFYRSSQRLIRKREGQLYEDLVSSDGLLERRAAQGKKRFYVDEVGAQQVLEHLREWRSKQVLNSELPQGVTAQKESKNGAQMKFTEPSDAVRREHGDLTSSEAFSLICTHFGVFPRIGEGLSLDVEGTLIDIALKISEPSDS